MRKLIFSFVVLLTTLTLTGQSVFRTINAGGLPSDGDMTKQISLNNVWLGSTFNYQLTGDQNFDENFLFNANILYNIEFDSSEWNFPIVSNLEVPITGSGFEDIEISVNPWRVIKTNLSPMVLVAHGAIGYSVKPRSTTELSPQVFRALAGVEASVPIGDNRLPLTLSVTPGWEWHNLDVGSNFYLEGTFIFPIAPNLGLLGEYKWSNNDLLVEESTFSAGVLLNGAFGDLFK